MSDSPEEDIDSTIQSIIDEFEKEHGVKITPGDVLMIDENTTAEEVEEHRRKFIESLKEE